eukprot:11353782-Alexandrium_andersonii.AAC.1
MSASLVGSEMCIRDSGCPVPSGARGRRAQRGKRAWKRSLRRLGVLHVPPVSYTHLTLPTICSV